MREIVLFVSKIVSDTAAFLP